jgi:hypothetical protein
LSGFRVLELYGERPRREVVVAKRGVTFALGAEGLRRIARPRPDWPPTRRGCHPGPRPFADADGSNVRPVSRDPAIESGALGWARDGRAVIAFPKGVCGGGRSGPGTYLVHPSTRAAELVFRGFGALWS